MELIEVSRRIIFKKKQEIKGIEVFYEYETNNEMPIPKIVHFHFMENAGVHVSGSYSQDGGFMMNGTGLTLTENGAFLDVVMQTLKKLCLSNE